MRSLNTARERKLQNKIEDTFSSVANIKVDCSKQQLIIWYGITHRPPACGSIWTEWMPSSGGPLYGQDALERCTWCVKHLEEYRCLLPKAVRDYEIVIEKA